MLRLVGTGIGTSGRLATPGTLPAERRARRTRTLVPLVPRRNCAARSPFQPSSTTFPSMASTWMSTSTHGLTRYSQNSRRGLASV